jgi:putative phosphoribosyl transferase
MFRDRTEAGRRLATRLESLHGTDAVVLGLPRGGVPVAFEVARALDAPLDVIVVRKLGVPFQPELAMGAIGEGDVRIRNDDVMRMAHVTADEIAAVAAAERAELERRVTRFRGERTAIPLRGRTVIVVDDGIATGATARAACQVARLNGAARVILAVPVAPADAIEQLRTVADEVVCLHVPDMMFAIGQWYTDFTQVSDGQVMALLARGPAERPEPVPSAAVPTPRSEPGGIDENVVIPTGGVDLPGHLTVPDGAPGVVAFAHGSGSSRHSPRNRFVAEVITEAGLGTLLFDLLTRDEELDRGNVFDVDLLAERLIGATHWLRAQRFARVGYFGASTGAAAALWAAAEPGTDIAAVVSRGGRPDLAWPRLAAVRAPTLLIVGGHDEIVLDLNRSAQAQLRCENQLAVVPGATHLFEEPGTLRHAAELARDWFVGHLSRVTTPAR